MYSFIQMGQRWRVFGDKIVFKNLCVVAAVLLTVPNEFADAFSTHPLLLVVLFDGFRWDYIDRFDTPNFHSLVKSGVRAKHVMNLIPTVTMANHYTILTGTYPETHGIVANDFYDTQLLQEYHMENTEDQTDSKWFDTGVEPIWVTNQLNSSDRFSGSVIFPTTLAPVKGISPTHQLSFNLFDPSLTEKYRIDTIVNWFLDEDKPINLGLLYFEEPDETGHQYGPNSQEMVDMVKRLDELLGYLIAKLKNNGLFEQMNILITADHGMADVLPDTDVTSYHIDMYKFVDASLYKSYTMSSSGFINPIEGQEDIVYNQLLEMQKNYSQVQVFKRTDPFMQHLHYSDNARISPIIVSVEEGYYLLGNAAQVNKKHTKGNHGYLPSVKNMHPFFIGHGPSFKEGLVVETLRNIDFYELMCHILVLNPAPNNGSLENIKHILRKPQILIRTKSTNYTLITYFCVGIFCALVASVFTIGAIRQRNTSRRSRVMSLEDLTLFDVGSKAEAKVPLLEEEDMEDETFDV